MMYMVFLVVNGFDRCLVARVGRVAGSGSGSGLWMKMLAMPD